MSFDIVHIINADDNNSIDTVRGLQWSKTGDFLTFYQTYGPYFLNSSDGYNWNSCNTEYDTVSSFSDSSKIFLNHKSAGINFFNTDSDLYFQKVYKINSNFDGNSSPYFYDINIFTGNKISKSNPKNPISEFSLFQTISGDYPSLTETFTEDAKSAILAAQRNALAAKQIVFQNIPKPVAIYSKNNIVEVTNCTVALNNSNNAGCTIKTKALTQEQQKILREQNQQYTAAIQAAENNYNNQLQNIKTSYISQYPNGRKITQNNTMYNPSFGGGRYGPSIDYSSFSNTLIVGSPYTTDAGPIPSLSVGSPNVIDRDGTRSLEPEVARYNILKEFTDCVYIYTGSATNSWQRVAKIKTQSYPTSLFGTSVSLNFTGNIAAISAIGESRIPNWEDLYAYGRGQNPSSYFTDWYYRRGVVYIFSGQNANWTKIARIIGDDEGLPIFAPWEYSTNTRTSTEYLPAPIDADFGKKIKLNFSGNFVYILSNKKLSVYKNINNNWIKNQQFSFYKGDPSFYPTPIDFSLNSLENTLCITMRTSSLDNASSSVFVYTGSNLNWNLSSIIEAPQNNLYSFQKDVSCNPSGNIIAIAAQNKRDTKNHWLIYKQKINQNINFPQPQTIKYQKLNFTIAATNDSNLPMTYKSSNTNVATIDQNQLNVVGAGTAIITVSQAGNNIYNSDSVSRILTIEKSDQTIFFPSIPTKTYGDSLFSPEATASSNLAVSYTSTNTSVAIIVGNLVNIIGVGEALIIANQSGNTNYNPAQPESQILIVNKGNQIINFQQIDQKVFDDPPFILSATSNSNLPIVFSSSNIGILRIQNNLATIISPGFVTITAFQNGNENYNPASTFQTINIKIKTNINFPNIPSKTNGDPIFNLNVTSNNSNTIYYTSSDSSIASVDANGNVTILKPGIVNITAYQLDNDQYVGASTTKTLQIEILNINNLLEVFQPSPYINYTSKTYKQNFGNEFYNIQLPRASEPHILLLDLNLYGFDEDKLEDCDIEMNAVILKTGFFKDVIKNPSILNLEIKDLKYPTGIISDMSDYLKEKSILKDVKVNNFINYDTSYYNNATIYSDSRYRFIKNKFFIQKPIASRTKNIPLPIFFKYKSPTNNAFYDLGEYNFQIYQGEDKDKKFIRNINYITGEEFGFLSYLTPGEYTAILSGKEEDFLISENSLYRKNQNISTTSLSVDLFTGEKFQEVYIESADEIWASYYLDYAELVSGSGFNTLSNQLPIAFNIDFERNFSGIVGIPSLQYKEYTGDFFNFCTSTQETIESDPICTKSLEFLCTVAATYEKSGIFEIDVPRKNFPKSKYGIEGISSLGMGSTLTPYVIDLIEGAVSGNNGSLITYLEDPEDQNYYTIAIDSALKDLCCRCKIAKEWSDPIKEVQTQIYSGISISESGDAIYKNVFFFDVMSPKALDLKYNSTYYSGQIIFKDFYEGDKLSFKQYPFDFDLVYKSLYSVSPSLTRKECTIDFIYSDTITGYNYFSGKQDLINKINNNLASKSYYSWLPFKYNPKIEFDYGPLLSGFDMGVNSKNEEVIGLVGLKEGKLGSYSMRLNLESRLQIYNYLAPKIIKLQVSEDGENWTDIVSSENRQPINTYLKYPTATVSRPTTETNIRYDELPNTKYKYEITVPISSEITSQNIGTDVEDLSGLAISIFNKFPLVSGNKNSTPGINSNVKKQVVCIPDPTGSGITCGTGFIDFDLTSTSKDGGFNCREPSEEEPCPLVWPGIIKSGSLIEESLVTEYDEDAKNSPYFGYSGNCCTGEYDIIMRPTGWCCSGTYISGINERGCKPPEKEPDGETKDQEFITISQEMNAFRLGFYDYNS